MSKTRKYILLNVVYFLALFIMHLYAWVRLKPLFGSLNPMMLLCIIVVLALYFPACSLLEKFCARPIITIFYAISAIWLGVMILMVSVLVACEPLRLFFDLDSRAAAVVIVLIVLLFSAYALLNGMLITVKTIDILLPNLDMPLKLVQLSDIHVGTIHNAGYLARIVNKTNALEPDMILITGDLVDGVGPVNKDTVKLLDTLEAKTYFTIGNHEFYDGVDKVTNVLKDTDVVILRNEVSECKGIQIVGIDYPSKEDQKDNPVLETLSIDRSRPSVLMYHPPVGIDAAIQAGISLQLSGHLHNGQLFPFNLLVKLFYPRINGLYKIEDLYLYASSGVGTWGAPMRLCSKNEITLINLIPS